MDLFYCKIDDGNFGDDMNAWFWDDAFPRFREVDPDVTMFGIGSILWGENIAQFPRIRVMGSGTGVGTLPKDMPDNLAFSWVRGPLTAKEFGLDADMALTDGAALCPRLDRFAGAVNEDMGPIFVPHRGTIRLPLNWERVAERAGLTLVSPADESVDVIKRIAGASFVLAESLHGAILADAFRKPWVPVAIAPGFNFFKWNDWGQSIGVDIEMRHAMKLQKQAYEYVRRARRVLKGQKARPMTAKDDPNSTIKVPNLGVEAETVSYDLNTSEKEGAKKMFARLAPVMEFTLVRELRALTRVRPYLSDTAHLTARQDEMLARIAKLSA